MKNKLKIIQTSISVETHESNNHLLLTFIENKRVVSTMIIPLPEWFKFYDENYKYYLPSLN